MSGGGVIRGPAGNNDCRIYVGNLPPDIRTKDIEDVFYKYGAIRDIDLKNRRGGPPFAFVEFEDPRSVAGTGRKVGEKKTPQGDRRPERDKRGQLLLAQAGVNSPPGTPAPIILALTRVG